MREREGYRVIERYERAEMERVRNRERERERG